MIRATAHTPTLGDTISFPADSVQHQMTILTLVTHVLLSVSVLKPPLISWRPVRQQTAYQETLGIIMLTLAFKRYHPIWFMFGPSLLHIVPSTQSTSDLSLPTTHATPCKRKRHSTHPRPSHDDDDNGPVWSDDTATVLDNSDDNSDDVVDKGDSLSTSHR